jgi:hypothetical protein
MEIGDRLIATQAREIGLQTAAAFEGIIIEVLDKALGAGNWALRDVPKHGELKEYPRFTEVLWDGRLLATIHRHQKWETTHSCARMKWSMTFAVQQHVTLEPPDA